MVRVLSNERHPPDAALGLLPRRIRCEKPKTEARCLTTWLRLVAQTLLVAVFFHPLAALVLGDFCFSSFLQRAHRGVVAISTR